MSCTLIESTTHHQHQWKPYDRHQSDSSNGRAINTSQAKRDIEEALLKGQEQPQVIYDNHSELATRVNEDEGNAENYKLQQGVRGYKCYQADGPSSE
jgi:hypothetical protein